MRVSHFREDRNFIQKGSLIFFRQLFAIDALDGIGDLGGRLVVPLADSGERTRPKLRAKHGMVSQNECHELQGIIFG